MTTSPEPACTSRRQRRSSLWLLGLALTMARISASAESSSVNRGRDATTRAMSAKPLDFDGDGRSAYVVTRRIASAVPGTDIDGSLTPGQGDRIRWHTLERGRSKSFEWGVAATDFIVSADFDGDGASDPAVWRAGPPEQAAFFILESSTGSTRHEVFGQFGDDPFVVTDYDGDGRAEPAVFRCPRKPGQCHFFYRGSSNNPQRNITYVPWGSGTINDLLRPQPSPPFTERH